MGKFFLGALVSLVLVAGGGFYFLWSGRFPAAATAPADIADRVAPWVLDRVLDRQTAGLSVTLPKDRAALDRGLSHYKENCLPCHAAPGIEKAELAQGLNPSPPELYSPMSQDLSDARLFWITKNGIRMTGMPAFGVNHTDDEIRDIVAFVRRLPDIDEQETAKLKPSEPEHHHH
jgi:mono/diheme cytochrome c family protein